MMAGKEEVEEDLGLQQTLRRRGRLRKSAVMSWIRFDP